MSIMRFCPACGHEFGARDMRHDCQPPPRRDQGYVTFASNLTYAVDPGLPPNVVEVRNRDVVVARIVVEP